jgi:CRISPR-associated protein Csm4
VVAHQEGERALEDFLEPFKRGSPPFILSDGFPSNFLPRPISAEFVAADYESKKELRKIEFIDFDSFNSIRLGRRCKVFGSEIPIPVVSLPHNTINRLTNTTLSEAGVYNLKEFVIQEATIYCKVASEDWKERVVRLFKDLSNTGYGRKKSIGKGQFSMQEVCDFDFPEVKEASGFVTLSSFCPAEGDPAEGLYKTFVKYGKLGEEFTFCGNPFKRPLVMIKIGSVFKTGSPPKEYYGRIVQEGISRAKPEVVHYAYAFAVPVKYPQIRGTL